jgi:outer membrane protein assembly factor BamB
MLVAFRSVSCLVWSAMLLTNAPAWGEGPWAQWQGPRRDAISTETGLVQELPDGGPPRLWLNDQCGLGYSGPAIVDNKLYILGSRDKTDYLLCLDVTTGEELWAAKLGETFENDFGDGPRSTPTIDDGRIYVLAPRGTLYCLELSGGKIVWEKPMQDLGGTIPMWGYAESPLVVGDRVVCTPGNNQGAITAFDKISGQLIWQSQGLTDVAHYSSILSMQHKGRTVLVQLLFKELVGVAADDGSTLWSVPFHGNVAVIPTPIVSEDKVYATAGYGAGCIQIKMTDDQPEVVYENRNMSNHHGGVILLDGRLYGYSEGKGWMCQDFETGEIVWREREALGKGCIAYADGQFYCLSEDSGELVMIAASPDGWEEHGRFTLSPQTELRKPRGKIWTHPVIANGRLYLRDQELLFSFDVTAK